MTTLNLSKDGYYFKCQAVGGTVVIISHRASEGRMEHDEVDIGRPWMVGAYRLNNIMETPERGFTTGKGGYEDRSRSNMGAALSIYAMNYGITIFYE